MEKYYVGLISNMGYEWQLFKVRPNQATAEETGYVAVTEGFEAHADAEELMNTLNYNMFQIEPRVKHTQGARQ